MQELIAGLEAAGLNPIVVDENTDIETAINNASRRAHEREKDRTLRETNIEFVKRVMEFGCPTGMMIQAFVVEALTQYSKEVLASTEEWDNGLIDHTVWRKTAQFLKTELDKKYGG